MAIIFSPETKMISNGLEWNKPSGTILLVLHCTYNAVYLVVV